MRRTLVQQVLPLVFCLMPPLAAVLVAAAIPPRASEFYLKQVFGERPWSAPRMNSPMDWLILGLGVTLFVVQMILSWHALRWRGTAFDERPDRWLTNLAQAAEWFPLLGLLGTVGGILQTFSSIEGQVPPDKIIRLYAPAITATGSGLFMALFNILPSWVVLIGRELILTLAGGAPSSPGETQP